MGFVCPVRNVNLIQGWGENPEYYSDLSQHPDWGPYPGHNGLDFGGNYGDAILACLKTRTRTGFEAGGYGNYVILVEADGTEYHYGHLKRIMVGNGVWVEAGQQIGEMGDSGCAEGVHLHFGKKAPKTAAPGGDPTYKGFVDPTADLAGCCGLEAPSQPRIGDATPSEGDEEHRRIGEEKEAEEKAMWRYGVVIPGNFMSGKVAVDILSIRARPEKGGTWLGQLPFGFPVRWTDTEERDGEVWLKVGECARNGGAENGEFWVAGYYRNEGGILVAVEV